MKLKTFHYLALAISVITVIASMGCNTKRNEKSSSSSPDSLNYHFDTTLSDIRFKQWLIDTMPFLRITPATANQNTGFVKRAITISSDSLIMSVMDVYEFNVSEIKSIDPNGKAGVLLNMLRVVDEVPEKKSTILFEHYVFYNPSPLWRFAYEAVEEYKNIKVFVAGASDTTTYRCLRGLIVSKMNVRKGTDGKLKKTNYDISWDGKTVKKRQTTTAY